MKKLPKTQSSRSQLTASDKRTLHRVVAQSSKMEGLSLARAKKDMTIIGKLKQYGRAFSL